MLRGMTALSRSALWSRVTADVRSAGLRLDESGGVAEDAFPVAMAESALAVLGDSNAVVLGGDFYELRASTPRPTCMNWFYEGADSPTSVAEARKALGQSWVEAGWFVTFVWRG